MTYSLEDLKQRLGNSGWHINPGNFDPPIEGTLWEVAESAHGQHKGGQAVGVVEEIETEIKLDMFQLEDLWRHMGLPTI